ncbi:unnamed protein product [Nippostrongylus brasiliensis]|uniref:CCT domain-containing protein n=1 Tax=Nippostrongylus brasiliensis TaxID=27835 RepID=A0A0N4XNT3_NIPBR|nr:unnamed protein product [Nippostrongylus brasiliensis]
MDDGLRHVPLSNPYRQTKLRHPSDEQNSIESGPYSKYQAPYYEASGNGYDLIYPDVYEDNNHQRIGKVVFPDVIELEGSGADELYSKYGKRNASALMIVESFRLKQQLLVKTAFSKGDRKYKLVRRRKNLNHSVES